MTAKKAVAKNSIAKKTSAQHTASTEFAGFPPRALTFLRGLAKHNRKEWFEEHRSDYETAIKGPLAELVEEVDVRLAEFAPEIVGNPKKSVFRIHRDVRFSKDKSPYKTHAACWFFHRDAGRGVGGDAAHGGAGFYFHIEPKQSFCGGGIWMPPRPSLQRIRQSLVDDQQGFEEIVLSRGFTRRFGELDPEGMLTRMPRGFEETHPAAKWLKCQSFTAGTALTPNEVTSAKLPDVLAKHYEAMTPFIRWLNEALGLKRSTGR
jgi:uncharacterized protein (TIGR02453 family)